jgi:hypothetical protein
LASSIGQVIVDFARKQLGSDCSNKEFDDFVGEYCIEKVAK